MDLYTGLPVRFELLSKGITVKMIHTVEKSRPNVCALGITWLSTLNQKTVALWHCGNTLGT